MADEVEIVGVVSKGLVVKKWLGSNLGEHQMCSHSKAHEADHSVQ